MQVGVDGWQTFKSRVIDSRDERVMAVASNRFLQRGINRAQPSR